MKEKDSVFAKYKFAVDKQPKEDGTFSDVMDQVEVWCDGNPRKYISVNDVLNHIERKDQVIFKHPSKDSKLYVWKERNMERYKSVVKEETKPYKSIYFESQFDVTPENSFVKEFLEILSQIRLYHWQTYGYAEHTALGDYYDTFSGLADTFVESYQGQFGREYIKQVGKSDIIGLSDIINDSTTPRVPDKVVSYIENVCIWLKEFRKNLESDSFNTTALQNIVDEMIGATDKLKYLLTLS